ncbi:DDE-type integrase/transposase/recombinase [Bacillus toyonensis]
MVAGGYYCRFSLSYRDVPELLSERGILVHPTTIMCWVHEYGDLAYQIWKTRDHQTVYMFMKRLVKAFGEPSVLTADKAPALLCVLKKLKNNGLYVHTKHCTVKYFNNLIEQDHRQIKRCFAKSAGFQSLCHASRTLKGIETI